MSPAGLVQWFGSRRGLLLTPAEQAASEASGLFGALGNCTPAR